MGWRGYTGAHGPLCMPSGSGGLGMRTWTPRFACGWHCHGEVDSNVLLTFSTTWTTTELTAIHNEE